MSDPAPAYFPCWISNHAGNSGPALKWGPRCGTSAEAKRLGKAEVDQGNATLSFVVRFEGETKTPLRDYVYPMSARRIIGHWLELLAACGAG